MAMVCAALAMTTVTDFGNVVAPFESVAVMVSVYVPGATLAAPETIPLEASRLNPAGALLTCS